MAIVVHRPQVRAMMAASGRWAGVVRNTNVVQNALSVPAPPHMGAAWEDLARPTRPPARGPRRLQITLAVSQLSEAQRGLGAQGAAWSRSRKTAFSRTSRP